MRKFSIFHRLEWNMKRKLFGYMLLLAALLLITLMSCLFLFGRFENIEKKTYESLDIQMEVFEKDIAAHFDYLAAAGIRLSEDMTQLLDEFLEEHTISFAELNDSDETLTKLQEQMLEPMKQKLFQEECSGIFVMLDTTINSSLGISEHSRSGLYLQINGYELESQNVLLYRGLTEIAKKQNIMPHRKWRLEFRTDLFPGYDEISKNVELPLEKSYYLTDLQALPGTSDQVILLVVPFFGSDGTYYGVCGFEISASYFMTYHAQPTKIKHLICLLSPGAYDTLQASLGLSCGKRDGYYRAPGSDLKISNIGGGLACLSGDTLPYIGITRSISLSPNNKPYFMTVMMPKSDYDQMARNDILKNIYFWLLLLFFTVTCCLYFSRQFLSPILKDLEQLKSDQWKDANSRLPEINDLFAFLAEQDREHEETLRLLNIQNESAQTEIKRLVKEYEQVQSQIKAAEEEISRLAYSRKQEVDPDDYQLFLSGIQTLTATERKIFEYYLSGKTVKEILEIAEIKESTLRYHNQNIYSKLGVHSLKQLLRYAALMKQHS